MTTKETGGPEKIKFRVQVQPQNKRNYVMEFDLNMENCQPKHFEIGRKVRISFDPKCPKQVLLIKGL